MIQVMLKKDKGPVVNLGEPVSGCLIILKTKDGPAMFFDGIPLEEEEQLLVDLKAFLERKKTWKAPAKVREQDKDNPNIHREHFKFDSPEHALVFKQQVIMAGLGKS